MRRLARWYDNRIVNVNVNILAAGAVALVFTSGFMHLLERTGALAAMTRFVGDRHFHVPWTHSVVDADKLLVGGFTFIVDLIADVAVYYGLHWVANHMPRSVPRAKPAAYANLSFIRDASLVQFERALLSPILYIAALGIQGSMMHDGHGVGVSTAAGFAVGLLVSRTLHTLWMLAAQRRAQRQAPP